jgi:hypothetical protein
VGRVRVRIALFGGQMIRELWREKFDPDAGVLMGVGNAHSLGAKVFRVGL